MRRTPSWSASVAPAAFATLLLAMTSPVPVARAAAVTTDVTVHVISKGAKFVGSSMGGALVTIEDADTGELLARGITTGSTGDTDRIMREPRARNGVLSTEDTAAFHASLTLEAPRYLRITAFGPLAQRQAANRASVTQWIVPGKHLTGGDGILLELPGFSVDVLAPPTHVHLDAGPQDVTVAANVTMMCGCPLTPGGLWDSDSFEIECILSRDGEHVATLPLHYAGTASQFEVVCHAERPGTYEAIVYAYDPATGNTGLDRTSFLVQE